MFEVHHLGKVLPLLTSCWGTPKEMQWSESAQSPWPGSCTKQFRGMWDALEFRIIRVESLLHSQVHQECFLISAMPVPCHNTVATWICHRVASNGTSGMHWRHIKKRKYKLAGFENLSHTEIRKGLKRGCQTLWIFRFSFFFDLELVWMAVVIPSSPVLKFRVSQHQAVRSVMSTSCTCSLPWQFKDKNSF